MVIDLNVRRNQPQCSNFALNIRTRQSHCGSCRSKGGRCRGTNRNLSYIFSAEKCTFIIKYSKAWKWCRTFSANFFDLNVRHLTCLRSFCVEHSDQLPLIWLLFPAPLCDALHHGGFSNPAGSVQGQDAVTGMLLNGV